MQNWRAITIVLTVIATALIVAWNTRGNRAAGAFVEDNSTTRDDSIPATTNDSNVAQSVTASSVHQNDEAEGVLVMAADGKQFATCVTKLVDWLTVRDTPDSLLAAAVLSLAQSSLTDRGAATREGQALLQRALAVRPTDTALRWLALSLCDEKDGCDPREHEDALRSLDPKNAASWLGEVHRTRTSQPQEFDDALRAMANSERFDLYWADTIEHVTRVVDSAPVAPPPGVTRCATAPAVMGIMAGLSIPEFAPLLGGCRLPDAAHRIDTCLAIGAAMRNGDTMIVQALGFAISRNVLRPGSTAEQQLQQERRRFDWQREQSSRLDERLQIDWLRLQRENRSEMSMVQALLRENGVPLEPPPEWQLNSNR